MINKEEIIAHFIKRKLFSLTVDVGLDNSIILPSNTITLNGVVTNQRSSTLTYLWEKVRGGACSIISPTSIETDITGLEIGLYIFKLTIKNDTGYVVYDTVEINVKPENATLTLNGGDETIVQGTEWNDPGYVALDYNGTPLTVEIVGSISKNIPGTYSLTYSTTGENGVTISAMRTVTVTVNESLDYEREFTATFISNVAPYVGKTVGVYFYVPETTITAGFPYLVWAHGAGENSGSDTTPKYSELYDFPGFPKYAHDGANPNYIIIAPQLPGNGQDWPVEFTDEVLAFAKTKIAEININKKALAGWSQGGRMAHNYLREKPSEVRVAISFAGLGYPTDSAQQTSMGSGNSAIWVFSSKDDTTYLHATNQSAGIVTNGTLRKTRYTSGGHSGCVTNTINITGVGVEPGFNPHPTLDGDNVHTFIVDEYGT